MLLKLLMLVSLLLCALACVDAAGWPQWRGANRDGHAAVLPAALPLTLQWRKPVAGETHAGLAATEEYLILADYDGGKDTFRCYDTTGAVLWSFSYPNTRSLDFTAGPRATPLIAQVGGQTIIYVISAFGELYALKPNGNKVEVAWSKHLPREFRAEVPQWGYAASPLLVDEKLIVNPGGANAALVALDAATGKTLWQTPGKPAAYASFVIGVLGGVRQVIGFDAESLGGWDVQTGARLWRVKPENEGDFFVGTPIVLEGTVLVSSDTNGTRLYGFSRVTEKERAAKGLLSTLEPKLLAANAASGPDMATPVAEGGQVFFTTYDGLCCLDLARGLRKVWMQDQEDAFHAYATLIVGGNRLLVLTESGKAFLLATGSGKYELVGKADLCGKTWSHPAITSKYLYVRDSKWVYCYRL